MDVRNDVTGSIRKRGEAGGGPNGCGNVAEISDWIHMTKEKKVWRAISENIRI